MKDFAFVLLLSQAVLRANIWCVGLPMNPLAQSQRYPSFRHLVASVPSFQAILSKKISKTSEESVINTKYDSSAPPKHENDKTESELATIKPFTTKAEQTSESTNFKISNMNYTAKSEKERDDGFPSQSPNSYDLLVSDCGTTGTRPYEGRVVGGDLVANALYPWMVSITYRYFFICGGTIISSKFVLTAAHCLVKTRSSRQIRVKFFSKHIQIRRTFLHPRFLSYGPDAALIQLQDALDSSLAPVCFSSRPPPALGTPVMVLGRGRVQETGPLSEGLHSAIIEVLSNETCTYAYGIHFNSEYVCAGTSTGVPDTCHGDSGGPLLYQIEGRWHQMGIVSFGNGCGKPKFPGVYSKVNSFYGWAKNIILPRT